MNIQIYGSKKSFDTKKAERYFKERKIKYQYIDLHQFGMAKAVFEAAKKCIPVEDMIDRKAKAYTRLYMDYIDEAKRERRCLKIRSCSPHRLYATVKRLHWAIAPISGRIGNKKSVLHLRITFKNKRRKIL